MSETVHDLARAVLDPVLAGSVFSPGSGPGTEMGPRDEDAGPSPWPEPDQPVQLLWCAASTELADVLPGVWRQVRRHDPDARGCIDITVDIDVLGRLVAADVESVPLAEVLAGLDDAEGSAAAAELPGLPAEVAVPALADLLERLLVAGR